MRFDDSRCKGSWLHKFNILSQWYNGFFEQCERCGKKVFFRTDQDGRPSNRIYLNYHIRDVLYPQHRLFRHEYPNSKANKPTNYNLSR